MARTEDIKGIVIIVLVVLVGFVFWTATAASERSVPSAQAHFSAEDSSVKKPVPIPDSVLSVLRDDEAVRIALANEGISAGNLPLSWFSASAIHLSNSKNPDGWPIQALCWLEWASANCSILGNIEGHWVAGGPPNFCVSQVWLWVPHSTFFWLDGQLARHSSRIPISGSRTK